MSTTKKHASEAKVDWKALSVMWMEKATTAEQDAALLRMEIKDLKQERDTLSAWNLEVAQTVDDELQAEIDRLREERDDACEAVERLWHYESEFFAAAQVLVLSEPAVREDLRRHGVEDEVDAMYRDLHLTLVYRVQDLEADAD